MADFPLTPAQRRAVEHRGSPLLIAAGAGSGKTRVLVERLLDRILRDGLDVDRFLLITYTRSAAAELRGRIRDAVSDALGKDPKNRRLRRQLSLVDRASISTIHSFCSSLLRENAVLCALRPDFRQMDEGEAAVVRGQTLDALLERKYAEMAPDFRLLADTLGAGVDDAALKRVVLDTCDAVQSHPDPEAWLRQRWEAPVPAGDAAETEWGKLLMASACGRAEFWKRRLLEARAKLEALPELEALYAPALEGAAESLTGFLAALDKGWDAACAHGPIQYPKLGGKKGLGDLPLALETKALWKRCKERMKKVTDLFDTDSAGHDEDFAAVRPVTDALFRLTAEFLRAYGEEKRRRNAVDYADLEHLALKLLAGPDGSPTAAAEEVSRRYDEILVDEYQDCNRVQERIFQAISKEGRNITMVGDVKQSIYRFRLADPGLFLEKYAAYRDEPGPGEGKRVLLQENFRSDAGILRGVNDLFSRLFSKELGELEYGEAEALLPGAGAADSPGSFELRLLETRETGLEPEAEAVALRVQRLLAEGVTVKDGAGERLLQPGDIAILLRSVRGRDRTFAAALEKRGIPCVCRKTGDSFTERREVVWALSLLQILDNPRQDIPLIAALRSPVWGFTADRLAEMRSARRSGCLYDALVSRGETDPLCAGVLEDLAAWRLLAADLPADRLLTELYARTGLPAAAEARERGSSLWLEELVRCARDLGQAGCRSLFRFVQRLREAEERQVSAVSTGSAAGSGVKITTIHDSKGLEYPVVLLADLGRRFHRADDGGPILIHPRLGAGPRRMDLERGIRYDTLPRLAVAEQLRREALSEELRVLYVAMTRARRKLIVFLRCRDRAADLGRLGLWAGEPIEPQALADCACLGDWITVAALSQGQEGPWALTAAEQPAAASPERGGGPRSGGEACLPFRGGGPRSGGEACLPFSGGGPRSGGEVCLPELTSQSSALRETADAGSPKDEPEDLVSELRSVLEWRYPYGADTRLPSKLTATALRETARQAEAAEGAEELASPERGGGPRSGGEACLPFRGGGPRSGGEACLPFRGGGPRSGGEVCLPELTSQSSALRETADASSPFRGANASTERTTSPERGGAPVRTLGRRGSVQIPLPGEALSDGDGTSPPPALRETAGGPPPLSGEAKPPLRLPGFLSETHGLTAAEKGTALHLAMQYARPEACLDPESAAREVERLREARFLRPDQAEAVDPRKLSDWYASPLGKRTLAAQGVHREFKFSLLAPAALLDPAGKGKILLQGVVDCWLEEGSGITVIDYKTDRVSKGSQEARALEYAPQLGAYAWALEQITGKNVKAVYVYFFATGTAVALPLSGFGKEQGE